MDVIDIDVQMLELMDVAGRRIGALLQADVAQLIHLDVVGGADEAADDAVAGGPAGRTAGSGSTAK